MIWLRSRLLTVINEAIRLPMVRSFRRAYRNVFGFHDNYWRKRFGTDELRQYRTDPQTEPEARFGQRYLRPNYVEPYKNYWQQSHN